MRKKQGRRSDCPVSFALDVFGDKWTLLIVRDLLFKSKIYFSDFIESEEGIATNILTDRLRTLESAGIVTKRADPSQKTKIIYSLTPKGMDLLPVLIEIILWSAKYDPKTATPEEFVAEALSNRDGLIREVRASHNKNRPRPSSALAPRAARNARHGSGHSGPSRRR